MAVPKDVAGKEVSKWMDTEWREKGSMTPEGSVLRACTDLLDAYKIMHFRMNSGAMFGSHKGRKWAVRFGSPGMADLVAFVNFNEVYAQWLNRAPLWIECKAPKKKQTADQLVFQERVQKEGHFYLLAHSSDDLLNFLKEKGVIR